MTQVDTEPDCGVDVVAAIGVEHQLALRAQHLTNCRDMRDIDTAVARLEQGGRDPECRLGAGYDQHLISLAAARARGTEVLGDSDAQAATYNTGSRPGRCQRTRQRLRT